GGDPGARQQRADAFAGTAPRRGRLGDYRRASPTSARRLLLHLTAPACPAELVERPPRPPPRARDDLHPGLVGSVRAVPSPDDSPAAAGSGLPRTRAASPAGRRRARTDRRLPLRGGRRAGETGLDGRLLRRLFRPPAGISPLAALTANTHSLAACAS